MSMTDPISDLLTRIRNAGMARLERTVMPSSKIKKSVAVLLEQEGYIKSHRVFDEDGRAKLEIELRYDADRKTAIRKITRISKPGRRVYTRCDRIPKVNNGLGICVVSTSQGVMSDREARRRRIGGELMCEVW